MLRRALVVGVVLLVSGCNLIEPGKVKLDRDKAKEILLPKLDLGSREQFYTCEADPALLSKPEFSSLQGIDFCDTELEVTGIKEEGEGNALVTYKITTSFKSGALEEYSKGIDAYKNRLLSLPGVFDASAANMGRRGVVNYTDPTDGRVYSVNVVLGNSTKIDTTPEWRGLSQLQEKLNSQISKGASSAENAVPFSRFDDGWRAGF